MTEGNVSIRFSVQDAEVVRQALEKLGTDGQAALNKMNTAGQTPSAGLKAVSEVVDGIKTRMTGLAFNLGPVGSGLIALGPIGLVAAAGLGAVVATFTALIAAAAEVGAKAQALQAFSQATGLTTDEIQKLDEAGAKFGITTDQVTSSVDRFSVNLDAARRATGPYYDMIREINPALADQLLTTKGVSGQLLILAAAYAQAGEKGQALLKNAFGRGGVAMAPLVSAIGSSGNIGNLGGTPGLSADEVKRMAAATAELNASWERIKTNIGAIAFTPESAQHALELRHDIEGLTAAVRDFSPSDAWGTFTAWVDRQSGGVLSKILGGKAPMMPNLAPSPEYPPQLNMTGLEGPAPVETPEQIANKYKTYVAALGSAATIQQQFNVKVGELNIQLEKGVLSWDDYNRAIKSEELQKNIQLESQRIALLGPAASLQAIIAEKQDQLNAARQKGVSISSAEAQTIVAAAANAKTGADLQIKVQNDVATATELYTQRQRELNVLVAQEKLTQDQANASLQTYATKIIPETIKQEEARKASLTNLKQLEQEAGDLRIQLDQAATDSTKNLGSAFVDMATDTKTASDAFKNLETQVIRSIMNMIAQMTIMAPIAAALQAVLKGTSGGGFNFLSFLGIGPASAGNPSAGAPVGYSGASAMGNVFDQGRMIHPYALGGIMSDIVNRPTMFPMANGTGLMGEAGPEAIMPLKRGPDGRLGVSGGSGGGNINVAIYNAPAGTTADVKKSKDSNGNTNVEITFKRMIEDHVNALAADRGSSFNRTLSRTIGSNPASTIG